MSMNLVHIVISCKLNLTWCRYIEAAFKLNNVQVLVRKTERLYGIETREY